MAGAISNGVKRPHPNRQFTEETLRMILCLDIGGTAIKGAVARSPSDIMVLERIATPVDDREAFYAAIGGIVAAHPEAEAVSISI